MTAPNGTSMNGEVQEYDVIVVEAGFAGISALHRCRKEGLKAHIFESGSDFGGVWHWNRYPGARVDSETPFYQLNIPEKVAIIGAGATAVQIVQKLGKQASHLVNLRQGKTSLEPTAAAEAQWKQGMDTMVEHTLFPYSNSWWNTSNVRGKKAENQSYVLGIATYERECREKSRGWQGFEVAA